MDADQVRLLARLEGATAELLRTANEVYDASDSLEKLPRLNQALRRHRSQLRVVESAFTAAMQDATFRDDAAHG